MGQQTRAYFGQKDAMQCVVIKRLIEDLNFNIQLVVCPTVREKDGLAMSSRHGYLKGEEERQAATVVYRALIEMKETFLSHLSMRNSFDQVQEDWRIRQDGREGQSEEEEEKKEEEKLRVKKTLKSMKPIESQFLREIGLQVLRKEPLVSDIEYISFGIKETMKELEFVSEEGAILSIAIKLGSVRLIDNMFI